tara:strand:+ start:2701 stop:3369 length:669 start_codon:yes stop_codon:yes gene_type:complete
MPTFFCQYTILESARDDCMTFFGGMTEEDDRRDMGDIRLLGRWSTVGESSGYCVCEADTAKSVMAWMYNWATMATIKVSPVVNDEQARRIILDKDDVYAGMDCAGANSLPREGESLYFIKYKFHEGKRADGFQAFANLTADLDANDAGSNKCLGRWHNLGMGSGIAVCSSKSEEDLYKWAYNWASMCDCDIVPVVHDSECRAVIQSKPGFARKHALLMAKMV